MDDRARACNSDGSAIGFVDMKLVSWRFSESAAATCSGAEGSRGGDRGGEREGGTFKRVHSLLSYIHIYLYYIYVYIYICVGNGWWTIRCDQSLVGTVITEVDHSFGIAASDGPRALRRRFRRVGTSASFPAQPPIICPSSITPDNLLG